MKITIDHLEHLLDTTISLTEFQKKIVRSRFPLLPNEDQLKVLQLLVSDRGNVLAVFNAIS